MGRPKRKRGRAKDINVICATGKFTSCRSVQCGRQSTEAAPSLSPPRTKYRPPYSSLSFEEPGRPPGDMWSEWLRRRIRAQDPSVSVVPTSELSERGDEIAAAPETEAATNSACFKWLHRHIASRVRFGIPIAGPYPARAKCMFGDGRMGVIRFAADDPVGIASRLGTLTTFLVGADIRTLFCKGAPEPLGGKLDLRRHCLHQGKMGAELPSRAHEAGRYVLGTASLGARSVPPRVASSRAASCSARSGPPARGDTQAASRF